MSLIGIENQIKPSVNAEWLVIIPFHLVPRKDIDQKMFPLIHIRSVRKPTSCMLG